MRGIECEPWTELYQKDNLVFDSHQRPKVKKFDIFKPRIVRSVRLLILGVLGSGKKNEVKNMSISRLSFYC